ncbi:hypothetical protein PIB30_032704 [Stylosanthes scabra]|uniref:Uncharacterized protein n=1 Tax=Stylosanthes scabra TaxID=79078 RepID=A0ABU6RCD6_9FABA|nr:hypothetical protein [Stylosanthes scabra]
MVDEKVFCSSNGPADIWNCRSCWMIMANTFINGGRGLSNRIWDRTTAKRSSKPFKKRMIKSWLRSTQTNDAVVKNITLCVIDGVGGE